MGDIYLKLFMLNIAYVMVPETVCMNQDALSTPLSNIEINMDL